MQVIEKTKKNNDNFQRIREQLSEARITIQLNGLEAALLLCLTGSVSGKAENTIRREADSVYHGLRPFLLDNGVTIESFRVNEVIGLRVGTSHAADLSERSKE